MRNSFSSTMRAFTARVSFSALAGNIILSSFAATLPVYVPMAAAIAGTCNGLAPTIVGAGTINGTNGSDVIIGSDGDDTVNSGGGNDTICVGDGNDTVNSGNGTNWISLGSGNNVLNGGSGNDTVTADNGNNTINVGNGTNSVTVGNGNNTINGGSGNDTFTTGNGNNTIDASNGTNTITTGDGVDKITGGSGNDTINSGGGDDVIDASSGTNTVNGGAGNDLIAGGSGNDTFDGGSGNDACLGYNGSNSMTCDTQLGTSGNNAMIVIKKDSVPDATGTFDFTSSPSIGISTVTGDNLFAFANADPGSGLGTTYTVTELAEAGWDRTSLSCTTLNGSLDTGTAGVVATGISTIRLNRGDYIVCTYVNTQIAGPDTDGDGVLDVSDNCSAIANPLQENNDADSEGDACDTDDDNDGDLDVVDNCVFVSNPDQLDSDGDLAGNACDGDNDNDGVLDVTDNCDLTSNPLQENNDLDSEGDACDTDDDNDGVLDAAPDNCVFVANPDQGDLDNDGSGTACDGDDDGDGIVDIVDNCPLVANADQLNTYGGPAGDACEALVPVCGDGLVQGAETCDDNNIANADGCSATCTVESGYQCSGAPSVCVATCNGLVPTIIGSGFINGTLGSDVIMGSSGNDTILGLTGNDTICGGDGNDSILGGIGNDWISGGNGEDAILGGLNNDDMYGDDGHDSILGELGNDDHFGGNGTDYCADILGGNTFNSCEANGLNGVIVIRKDAQPNDAQDFSFTGTVDAFDLDDDADGTLSNEYVVVKGTGLFGNSYTATETPVSGWDLTDITCLDPLSNSSVDLGAGTATINLSAAEVVTCTFTNTQVVPAVCGNGVIELGEQCDDSNVLDGDGCSSICQNQQLTCTPTDTDLSFYIPFDEFSGPTAFDVSPNNVDGTHTNGVAVVAGGPTLPGYYNTNHVHFDGTDDYVDFGNAGFPTPANFSVSVWVNPDAVGLDQQIVSKGYNGTQTEWELKTTTADGKVSFQTYDGARIGAESSVALTNGVWTHLVGTFDGTTWSIYQDGVLAGSAAGAAPIATGKPIYVGAVDANGTPVQFWDGGIDDLRFFDRALTLNEVNDLYAGDCEAVDNSLLACTPTDTNLTAYWKFDENAGTDAFDTTANNNDGIIGGSAAFSASMPTLGFANVSSLDFDGVDDVVTVAGVGVNFNSNNKFSGSAWVNADTVSGYQTIFHNIDDTVAARNGYLFTLNNGVPEVFLINDFTSPTYINVTSTGPISTGAWHNLAFSYDGSGLASGIDIFVDGVNVTGLTLSDTLSAGSISSAQPFEIGRRSFAGIQAFDGKIDDVRIYSDVFVPGQVTQLSGGQCNAGAFAIPDTDGDGYNDTVDNCPSVSNPGQTNTYGGTSGDACEDTDEDTILDAVDNCPLDANPGQDDGDENGIGDVCDAPIVSSFSSDSNGSDDGNQPNGGHRGNRTNVFGAASSFLAGLFGNGGNVPSGGFGGGGDLPSGGFGGGPDVPFSQTEHDYICSMQKIIPNGALPSFVAWLGGYMANLMGRDVTQVTDALTNDSFCAPEEQAAAPAPVQTAIRIDKDGRVVTANPVWNACVSGENVPLGLLKRNPDTVGDRRDNRPLTCADYHKGADSSIWKVSGYPNLEVKLDADGRLVGALPTGYVAVKDAGTANVVAK